MYKQGMGTITRLSDGACIPQDAANADYAQYLAWVATGNTPESRHTKSEAVALVWERIKVRRDVSKNGGVLVAGKWFHTDTDSRGQYLGLLRLADAALTAGGTQAAEIKYAGQAIMWKTMNGSFTPLTVGLINGVFSAAAGLDFAAFSAAEQHRANMAIAQDPQAYDFSAGWPPQYTP